MKKERREVSESNHGGRRRRVLPLRLAVAGEEGGGRRVRF